MPINPTITLELSEEDRKILRDLTVAMQGKPVYVATTAAPLSCYEGDEEETTAPGDGDEEPAPAPPATTDTPAPPPATSEETTNTDVPTVDVNGLPWDHRIHSDKKGKNKDGTWRFRRNLDPAVKAQVMAELEAVRDAGKTPAVAPAADVPPPPAPAPTEAADDDDVPPPPTEAADDDDVPPPPVVDDVPPAPPVPAPDTGGAPEGYRMTEKANGVPYAGFVSQNWSDKALIEHGYMEAIPAAATVSFPEVMKNVTAAVASNDALTIESFDAVAQEVGLPQFFHFSNRPDLLPQALPKIEALINGK